MRYAISQCVIAVVWRLRIDCIAQLFIHNSLSLMASQRLRTFLIDDQQSHTATFLSTAIYFADVKFMVCRERVGD